MVTRKVEAAPRRPGVRTVADKVKATAAPQSKKLAAAIAEGAAKKPSSKKAGEPAPAKKEASKLKLPKTLAGCADLMYETKQRRLAMQKQVDELEKLESALREHLIETLPKSDATGVAGKIARAFVEKKRVVHVADWKKLCARIVKDYNTRKSSKELAFLLLQKRVSEAAVKELWEAGKKVEGCEAFDVPVISLTKV